MLNKRPKKTKTRVSSPDSRVLRNRPHRGKSSFFTAHFTAHNGEKIDQPEKAYESLIRCLARRDHSEKELQQKLSLRYTESAVDDALTKARENNWLKSPEELSELFGRYLDRRDKGIIWINRELQKKGLPEKEADPDRELEKSREILSKRFPSGKKLTREEKQKAYRYLTNRGFEAETIRKVINEKL